MTDELLNSAWRRRLISGGALLVLLAAALVANGYTIGLGDHFIHLPYLRRAIDPAFLSGDLLVGAAEHHLSWFWILQVPLVNWFGLEPTYFAIHMLSWLCMLAGLISLARALAPPDHARLVGWLACIPAVLVPPTFGAIPTFDSYVVNRTVVMGGELFALSLAIRGRAFTAMLLAGALANLHATTAVHTAVLVGCILVVQPGRWRLLARAAMGGVIGALPLIILGIVRMTRPTTEAAAGLDYDGWRAAVELHWPFHHFLGWMDLGAFSPLIIAASATLAAWRRTGQLVWAAVLAGVVALCAINFVATDLLHVRVGTVLHLYESGRLLSYMGFLAASVVFVRTRGSSRRETAAGTGLLMAMLSYGLLGQQYTEHDWAIPCSVFAVIAAAVLCALSTDKLALPRRVPPAWVALVVACALSCAAAVIRGDNAAFGFRENTVAHDFECQRELSDTTKRGAFSHDVRCGLALMRWAETQLPPNAVVVMPPFFVHPLGGFRDRVGRSVVVTFKDGGEAVFDPVFAKRWIERLTATAGPIPLRGERSFDGYVTRVMKLHAGYRQGDEARFRLVQARYGATHVVCERSVPCGSLHFPIVYEDAVWRVFQITPAEVTAP